MDHIRSRWQGLAAGQCNVLGKGATASEPLSDGQGVA